MQRNALSLLELLVVISIISLLIALILPSLKQSMRLAASAICMYNLRDLSYGLHSYREDNDGWLPIIPGRVSNFWMRSDNGSQLQGGRTSKTKSGPEPQSPQQSGTYREDERNLIWFQRLFPMYLSEPMLLSCPEDPYRSDFAEYRSRLRDPATANYASYGINGFIANAGGGFLGRIDRFRPTRPLDTILLADLGPDESKKLEYTGAQHKKKKERGLLRNRSEMSFADGSDPFNRFAGLPWLTARHADGMNVLTLEGGVRFARTADLARAPLQPYYTGCAGGGCTLCLHLNIPHYSFARDRLYWWTGPKPSDKVSEVPTE